MREGEFNSFPIYHLIVAWFHDFRPLCAKRNAEDRLNLLKLLKAGAIFCSERYPEDAEAIDREIGRQLNEAESGQMSTTTTSNTRTIEVVQCDNQNTTITITVGEATTTCATASGAMGSSAAEAAANEANANPNRNPNANGDIWLPILGSLR